MILPEFNRADDRRAQTGKQHVPVYINRNMVGSPSSARFALTRTFKGHAAGQEDRPWRRQ